MPGPGARSLLERAAVVAAVLLLVVAPTAVHGWPTTPRGNLFVVLVVSAGLALVEWRHHPRVASVSALALTLAALAVGGWFPDPGIVLWSASFAVLALGWSGRAARLVALGAAAYLVPFGLLSGSDSWVAVVMFTVPAYVAGTALRLHRETAELLALRAQELEEERELFARIALRHERARIASELHDIVGHALSVMVVQAAAGQRLVDAQPALAQDAFVAIADSARQGTRDLDRLVELLGRTEGVPDPHADLSLIEEVVARATSSGLDVTCRFEGSRDGVPGPVAHLAFRVVQESLTNALRYAPGSHVRVLMTVHDTDRGLTVRVENDPGTAADRPVVGTGRGLVGLRERIVAAGGRLSAGTTGAGGWRVEADLPVYG